MLLATGNSFVAWGVAFLCLYGVNEVCLPQPGVIFYPQASGSVPYLVQRHGKLLLTQMMFPGSSLESLIANH